MSNSLDLAMKVMTMRLTRFVLLAFVGLHGGAWAQTSTSAGISSEKEAVLLVQSAVDYVKQHGLDAAAVEMNNPNSPFNTKSEFNPKGDLYVISVDAKGLQRIHGKNPKIRGRVTLDMRDVDGVYLVRDMVAKCMSAEGKGWSAYRWFNPATGQTDNKRTYLQRVPGTETCMGTGIYR